MICVCGNCGSGEAEKINDYMVKLFINDIEPSQFMTTNLDLTDKIKPTEIFNQEHKSSYKIKNNDFMSILVDILYYHAKTAKHIYVVVDDKTIFGSIELDILQSIEKFLNIKIILAKPNFVSFKHSVENMPEYLEPHIEYYGE